MHLDTITATYTHPFLKSKTAIKKMSSKKKKAWKSDSEHGAFLFLLYNFCVYDPNDYSEVEIYDHPDFPFKDNYAKNNLNISTIYTLTHTSLTPSPFGEHQTQTKHTYNH